MVLCVDEMTSLQPRPRRSPTLAAKQNQPTRVEHEYGRCGALNLFAAFDTRSGKVYGQTAGRKRQAEFIAFLEYLDKEIPTSVKTVRIVLDNLRMHKGKQVQAWLAKHPRFVFHLEFCKVSLGPIGQSHDQTAAPSRLPAGLPRPASRRVLPEHRSTGFADGLQPTERPLTRTVLPQLAHEQTVRQHDQVHVPGLALAITQLTVSHAKLLLTVPMKGLRACPAMPVRPHDPTHFPGDPIGHQDLAGFWSSFLYRQRITIRTLWFTLGICTVTVKYHCRLSPIRISLRSYGGIEAARSSALMIRPFHSSLRLHFRSPT